MTAGELKAYAAFAFDVLVARLNGRQPHRLSAFQAAVPGQVLSEDAPLFVTWNTVDDELEQLRGCIGTFEAQNLDQGIRQYALVAALQDPRFPPITASELENLECAVTILSQFEKIHDPLNWEVGKHGIKAVFHTQSGHRASATFLPDVALEQGWDQKTTLRHLAMKAGVPVHSDVSVTRYRGLKSGVRYREYLDIVERLT